jgi:hypothetical protein
VKNNKVKKMSETTNKEMLIDAIDYQDGSIVSKQIIKKPNGI